MVDRSRGSRRYPAGVWSGLVSGVVVALLVTGCTPGGESGGGETPLPEPTVSSPSGISFSPPEFLQPSPSGPVSGEDVEFAFEPPEPTCPPVSELRSLPGKEQHSYRVDPSFHELDRQLAAHCTYMPEVLFDDIDHMLLDDHVVITSQIRLFPNWYESSFAGQYPALPVDSEDLADWFVGVFVPGDADVWREWCGSEVCEEGERPTSRTHRKETLFAAHVGNLEFYVAVIYGAESLPGNVRRQAVTIFRELVLATMEVWNRVDCPGPATPAPGCGGQ